jgi:hypothetical protein
MPLTFLVVWLTGLLSSAVLGGGIYLVYEWYVGEIVATAWLIVGIFLLVWSVAGRWLVLLARRQGPDEPHSGRGGRQRLIDIGGCRRRRGRVFATLASCRLHGPAAMTTAPAFSICLVTESINSSQLLAKTKCPVPLECCRPLQCSPPAGSGFGRWYVPRCSFHERHHRGFHRGQRRRAASLPAWC